MTSRNLEPLVLSAEERQVLQDWARRRTTSQALALRSRIVLACGDGGSITAVAVDLGISRDTVRKWRSRFVAARLDGLRDERRPRAPRGITDEQAELTNTKTLEDQGQRRDAHRSPASMSAMGAPQSVMSRNVLRPSVPATTKYRNQPSVGEVIRWSIGIISILTMAWLSIGLRSSIPRVTRAAWPAVTILIVATCAGLLVISIPRTRYPSLFAKHFGWLPVFLGLLTYPYWYWIAHQYGSPPNVIFFEISAQIIPVLLLAAIIDVRQSEILNSYQLALPVIAAFLGESAALTELVFGHPETGTVDDYATVASSLVTIFLALILAVLAGVDKDDRRERRRPLSE